MRSYILIFSLCVVFNTASIGQESFARHAISMKWVGIDHQSSTMDWWKGDFATPETFTGGAEISYHRWLNRSFNLQLPARLGVADLPEYTGQRAWVSLDAILQLKMLDNTHFINPYIMGGAGVAWTNFEKFTPQIPAGAGFNLRLWDGFFANAQIEYRYALDQGHDAFHYTAGVHIPLGSGQRPPKIVDSDGDGIPDDEDECPFEAGLPEFDGCPDTDGDGIPDHKDACPHEPGPASTQGCPDRDGDGIPDKDDLCPDVAGLAAFGGCPDSDGDGIPDHEDDCPYEAGPVSTRGCPDRDGDGVPDKDDRCPDEPGPANLQGCPDRDNDGIPDIDDRCPDVPGPASNYGCPELKESEKAIIRMAVQNVNFITNSATLTQSSFGVLDQLVLVLENNPAYGCDISGHTDATGTPEHNQDLSERRAKACYDYLIQKGIDPSRLSHTGFGQSRPITENRTPEGRATNRRVEFDVRIR